MTPLSSLPLARRRSHHALAVVATLSLVGLSLGACSKKQRPEPAGTAGPTGPASVDPVTARARERVAPYKAALKQALEKGMAESPEAAIEACAARAPEIARAASSDGMTIGRTALRLRNPDNAPRPWVVPVMEELSTAPKGTMASRTLSLPGGKIGYVEAIWLAPAPCPVCHGDPAKPIRDKLAARYPQDQATGFVPGDFRGVLWAELDGASVLPKPLDPGPVGRASARQNRTSSASEPPFGEAAGTSRAVCGAAGGVTTR